MKNKRRFEIAIESGLGEGTATVLYLRSNATVYNRHQRPTIARDAHQVRRRSSDRCLGFAPPAALIDADGRVLVTQRPQKV